MIENVNIQGAVAPGFEEVRDPFTANFSDHGEVGASVAVYVNGELVVDLWGGVADIVTQRPWAKDTVGLIYSATKGASAVVVNLLADRGELDLEAPVASYWPEFDAEEARAKRCWSLSCSATRQDWQRPTRFSPANNYSPVRLSCRRSLARSPSGSRVARPAITPSPSAGWLVGELVRRVTGRSLGTVFAQEVARPLDIDFWIGLPPARADSVAQLVDAVRDPGELDRIVDPEAKVKARALKVAGAFMDPACRCCHARCRPMVRFRRRAPTSGTTLQSTRPSSQRRTASRTDAPWPGCTRPALARSTACACCPRLRSNVLASRESAEPTPC